MANKKERAFTVRLRGSDGATLDGADRAAIGKTKPGSRGMAAGIVLGALAVAARSLAPPR